jgi:hypothetical protein
MDCIQLAEDHGTDDCNVITGFSLDLIEVNYDGPSLKLSADFTISLSMAHSVSQQLHADEDRSKAPVEFAS